MRSKKFISLSEAARRLGVLPKVLCDLLWIQAIDPARCPLKGRKRFIPISYLTEIREVLVRRGKLPAKCDRSSRKKLLAPA